MTFPLSAQDHPKKVLTLSSAIQIAKEQSKMLLANRTEQKISQARLQQAKNEYLPSMGVSMNYTRISNNITPFSISLPNVGEFVLNPQVLDQSFNSLQVKQNLWSGGRVRYGLQVRKLEEQVVKLDGRHIEHSVADSVATSWYTIMLLNTSGEIIKQNIRLLKDQYNDLSKQEKQGVVISNDLLKLELAISNLETSLLEINSNKSIYTFNLATMLNDLPNTEYELENSPSTASTMKLSLEELFADALKNRVELDMVNLRKKLLRQVRR
jgi:outer membrane protein TolC